MDKLKLETKETARIPTRAGEFQLTLYANNQDNKEHLALVMGDVFGQREVLVRIHSECFTGDVMESTRCDCGEQLEQAMKMVAEAGSGVIIYLRQEGRGIGLLEKLRAYNLQDQGYDTVEANLLLGHQADQRDYTVAAHILANLGVTSIQLLTNNPQKINSLQKLGVEVMARIPLYGEVTDENKKYFNTKIERLNHFPPSTPDVSSKKFTIMPYIQRRLTQAASLAQQTGRPFVTLTYAQTLDGSIALRPGNRLHISNAKSYQLSHQLRANHDAILVGVGTVLADNPRLTVRLVAGKQPQPIILDGQLRCPPDAALLQNSTHSPWIFTRKTADKNLQAKLEALGARVFRLDADANQKINLNEALELMYNLRIERLMVEGGGQIITSFIRAQRVDQMVLTLAPMLVGGLHAMGDLALTGTATLPRLQNLHHQFLDDDLILRGDPIWKQY